MIGALLNERYQLNDELGRGGMGIVYRGSDELLRRPVAVKLLTAEGLGTEGRARLLQEARAAASLNHPNIVSVYDVGEAKLPGQPIPVSYIIMELIPGHSLSTLRPTELKEIIHIFDQVCLALEVAHESGLIHRDLKPENIVVTPSGQAKLMDFGLAHTPEAPPLGEPGSISGTLAYMAPELILGKEASPQSDLYALGVIFYEYLAGRPAFEAENLTALLTQRLHASVVPPSTYNDQIPFSLDVLIMRLLSRRPEGRPDSVTVVRETLAAFSSPLPPLRAPGSGSQINRLVRGRLVGRETSFAQLVGRWQLAVSGQNQLLLINGEPGVGKTRLVRELTSYAELSGGIVLAVECYADAGLPYASFAQLIGEVLRGDEDPPIPEAVLADMLMLTPDLRPSYAHILTPTYADQESKQAALIESVMALFAALTAQSPLLLFFDDLHWADSGTLSLIRHLAQRLRRRPLMIVGAFREAELSEDRPLQSWLAELHGKSWLSQLQLPRLDKVQAQELLTTLFSSEVSWDLTEAIYRQSEGNPFFIEEICRALVESGNFYFEAGRWHRPSLNELAIPQGLKSAIGSRLRRLSKFEQETLELAAMLGREFSYDRLRAVSRLPEEGLIAALEKAQGAQLIEEVTSSPAGTPGGSHGDLRFSFSQALIRSTILSSMGSLRRRRLGKKVATALEKAYPDRLDELAPLLGRYFAESGQSQKAAGYLLRAGDAAQRLFAHEEAIKFYELALPLLAEQGDHTRAAHTYMKLGLTYHNTFQFDRARQAYEDGFALWQRMPTTTAEPLTMAPHALRTHLRHLPTLDPTRANHVSSSIVIQQLFSGLVRLSGEHEVVPDVATSWEVLEDGQKYIFYLRDDVRWSDGRPVTAGDFEFAWKRTLAPESGPYPAELLLDIRNARAYHERRLADPGLVGVRAADDWILIIELENPSSYFLHLLAQPVAMPVPRHVVQAVGPEWVQPGNLVTNGPFLVKEWRPDHFIHLERNAAYHGQRNGNLEAVEVALLDEAGDAWRLYQEDELDCLYLTPLFSPGRLEHARQHSPDQYMGGPTPSIIFLALDVTRPPFDNQLVRQALAMATDKEMLANVTLTGLYPPAGGGFVPPGIPGHVPGIGLPYDPHRARELLSGAGYPGSRAFPALNARVLDANIYQIISRALHSQWLENLGLNIEFQSIRPAARAHIYLTAVAPDYLDPDTFLRANNWSPETGWHHPVFEQLVDQGRRVVDREKRLAMYRQAETILVEEAALIPLVYGRFHLLLKPWLVKYPTSPLLIPHWKDTVMDFSETLS